MLSYERYMYSFARAENELIILEDELHYLCDEILENREERGLRKGTGLDYKYHFFHKL